MSRKPKGTTTTTPFGCAVCGLPDTPGHDRQWRRGDPGTHTWQKPGPELIRRRSLDQIARRGETS